jgi:hypothetical protein
MGRFAFTLTSDDAIHIAQRLRQDDRIEADATCTRTTDDERGKQLAGGPGLTFTVWSTDGEAVAMGGWVPLWPGVASAWMLATDRIAEVGIALDRAAIAGHLRLFASGFHRLQAWGLAARRDSRAWLLDLGYIPEGTHPGFGRHGETFMSFAKLRKE